MHAKAWVPAKLSCCCCRLGNLGHGCIGHSARHSSLPWAYAINSSRHVSTSSPVCVLAVRSVWIRRHPMRGLFPRTGDIWGSRDLPFPTKSTTHVHFRHISLSFNLSLSLSLYFPLGFYTRGFLPWNTAYGYICVLLLALSLSMTIFYISGSVQGNVLSEYISLSLYYVFTLL